VKNIELFIRMFPPKVLTGTLALRGGPVWATRWEWIPAKESSRLGR
jgi:hypothetical protein